MEDWFLPVNHSDSADIGRRKKSCCVMEQNLLEESYHNQFKRQKVYHSITVNLSRLSAKKHPAVSRAAVIPADNQNTSQNVAFQGFQHCSPLSICLHIKVDITCQHINKSMVDLPACVHSELPAGVRLFSGDLIFGFGLQPNHRNLVYRKAH